MLKGKKVINEIEESYTHGTLDKDMKTRIAQEYGMPVSRVESLSSFYRFDDGRDMVCTGLSCSMKGGRENVKDDNIRYESCLGYCDHAPVMRIDGKFVTKNGNSFAPIEESTEDYVTKNRKGIEKYMEEGGYSVLKRVLQSGNSSEIYRTIEKESLRGMGGAGFPVAVKAKSFQDNRNEGSYLLVNAHEGEPGTFKDRTILELNPHRLIEGALIVAGANKIGKIVFGVKKEYVLAIKSLRAALDEMKQMCQREFKSPDLPDIVVEEVGGTYVTGEETALMEAIEGKRSEPRLRPPFPTENGLYGEPTLVHNVETLSVISDVTGHSGKGIEKIYCLTGDVKKPGHYSAKLGTSAREMIEKFGETDSSEVGAIMPGGLSGGILPSSFLNINLDFDEVKKAGAGLGTGALIVLSKDRCKVDSIRTVTEFFKTESCGKCMPCRYGTASLDALMKRIAAGDADKEEIDAGSVTATAMIDGSICALGQAAGKVFLDALKYFRNDMEDHIAGHCPSGVCMAGGDSQ